MHVKWFYCFLALVFRKTTWLVLASRSKRRGSELIVGHGFVLNSIPDFYVGSERTIKIIRKNVINFIFQLSPDRFPGGIYDARERSSFSF